MWGTSLPEDKVAGDLGNVIEATSIGGRQSDFFTAGKLAPGNLRLLQQYLPPAVISQINSITSPSRIGLMIQYHDLRKQAIVRMYLTAL
jgi:hypothetical protein